MTRSPSAWAAGAKCTAGEGPRRVCISQDREPGIWKVVYSLRCSVHELEKGVRLTKDSGRTGYNVGLRWTYVVQHPLSSAGLQ